MRRPRRARAGGTLAQMIADMPEIPFMRQMMGAGRQMGWTVVHWSDSRRSVGRDALGRDILVGDLDAKGFPDCVFAREVVLFVEFKAAPEWLDPDQRRWREVLLAAGQSHQVWRPDGIMEKRPNGRIMPIGTVDDMYEQLSAQWVRGYPPEYIRRKETP